MDQDGRGSMHTKDLIQHRLSLLSISLLKVTLSGASPGAQKNEDNEKGFDGPIVYPLGPAFDAVPCGSDEGIPLELHGRNVSEQ